MKLFDLTDSINLSITCAKKYNNCAFDGCFYYFTLQCSCEIIKTDCCFYIAECYNTCKEYDCICYDQEDHCFWASRQQCNTVFKLNCNMCEIDCITIHGNHHYIGDITGISYDCCTNSLIISFGNCIVKTNKENGHSILLYKSNFMHITSVLSLCPNLVFSGIKNNDQYVYFLDTDGLVQYSHPVSHENRIKNILFNPCVENDDQTYLDFFVLKKGCYPYIFRCHLFLNLLPFQPYECNFNICDECCCSPDECGDPCASILQSIALVEAGIAHILNCEGEKMQKIINEGSDINAILAANKEINNTISNVSQLEYLLYLKLNALVESGICKDFCVESEADTSEICSDAVHLTSKDYYVKKMNPNANKTKENENSKEKTLQIFDEPPEI